MKEVKLSNVKTNEIYQFKTVFNGGAGSGSQAFYTTVGKVKEVNPEFIRVFSGVGKQSNKIYNKNIIKVYSI